MYASDLRLGGKLAGAWEFKGLQGCLYAIAMHELIFEFSLPRGANVSLVAQHDRTLPPIEGMVDEDLCLLDPGRGDELGLFGGRIQFFLCGFGWQATDAQIVVLVLVMKIREPAASRIALQKDIDLSAICYGDIKAFGKELFTRGVWIGEHAALQFIITGLDWIGETAWGWLQVFGLQDLSKRQSALRKNLSWPVETTLFQATPSVDATLTSRS